VEKAHRRIEARCSHASLKADITKKCWLVNDKKVVLDAKTDISASSQRLDILERELKDLKESSSNRAAYPRREKLYSQFKVGSRGPGHPAEDRAYRVEYLESADSIG
jgi:hypothetical protein